MQILLVEDEELDIIAIQRAFKKHDVDFQMGVTRNGTEALKILRSQKSLPEDLLILLDINMPRMTGLEFLTELRTDLDLQRIPVFVLTTSDEYRDVDLAYTLGISGYLLKKDVGDNSERLVDLLKAYAAIVHFPS